MSDDAVALSKQVIVLSAQLDASYRVLDDITLQVSQLKKQNFELNYLLKKAKVANARHQPIPTEQPTASH